MSKLITLFRIAVMTGTFFLGTCLAHAENPMEGSANPHANAPRKKITQAQKKAAADARKKLKEQQQASKPAPQSEQTRKNAPAAANN